MHVPRYSRIRRRRRIRPRHRLRNTTALVVVVIITAWCIFASRFLWFPRIDHQPDHVDAIVQLGGPHGGIEAYEKTRRAAIGHTTNLVISDPYIDKPAFGARLCAPEPGITVYCVHPEPSTTRGEARAIEALVKEHGWTHVMVYATGKYHVERTRMIIGRCTAGTVDVGYHNTPLTWEDHVWEWSYQTAGVMKMLTQTGC